MRTRLKSARRAPSAGVRTLDSRDRPGVLNTCSTVDRVSEDIGLDTRALRAWQAAHSPPDSFTPPHAQRSARTPELASVMADGFHAAQAASCHTVRPR